MLKAKLFVGLPLLLSIVGAILASVAVLTALRGFRSEGRQLDLDVLILASASLLISFAGLPSSVSFLRRRLEGKPPNISAFTEKRFRQIATAYSLPYDERRSAPRPLFVRGYIRLALFAGMIVALVALAPRTGVGIAFVVAWSGCAAVFLLLHRWFEL